MHGQAGWRMLKGAQDALSPPAPGGVGFSLQSPAAMAEPGGTAPQVNVLAVWLFQWKIFQKIEMCDQKREEKTPVCPSPSFLAFFFLFRWKVFLLCWARFLPQRPMQKFPPSQRSPFFLGALPEEEGVQGWAGLAVDPVGTTTPRALGHHCRGCKATRGLPSQPFWPGLCCKKWDVCRA